ncbi:secreted and transmembrane protein 1 isoform X4 [Grammomys surdaster]|uniref:secreted and transmembrane protein 1 isoform X4 n=1 Tax=Grammomys surdaster TaxID=491861 RepID=UPI0010A08171|nr:secreted and transmembrane protein 1 isoform X4 [Grammomys surdaster]
MLTFPLVSTIPTLQLFIILLLVVSLNAHNKSWDRPICTEGIVSVPRGDPAVMTCNISNAFTDITIQLTAHGKEDRTIFNKKPQGNFSWSGWELHVQGGQAQLVIKDTQDDHTGIYLWQLHGCQRYYRNITLNISEPSNEDKVTDTRLFTPDPDPVKSSQLEAKPGTLVGVIIAVLGVTGIITFVCYRRRRS